MKGIPLGVKLAIILNVVHVVVRVFVILMIIFSAFAVLSGNEMSSSEISTRLTMGCVLQLGFTLISIWLIDNLQKMNADARRMQIFFSVIGLFVFPIGTIIHSVILYSMFREDTKRAFGLITDFDFK